MMFIRRHISGLTIVLATAFGTAELRATATTIPGLENPTVIGSASLNFLGFTVYHGRLFTENGRDFRTGEPVALEIVYNRSFSAGQMLDTTRDELARVDAGRADEHALAESLSECFRVVGRGDQFLAVSDNPDRLRLWLNGNLTCELEGNEVGNRFLAIWLSDNSRFPSLSRQLLGI